MANALLVAPTLINGTSNGIKNMGDYIQSLAGEMFFEKIDEYIDREKLADYKSKTGKTRMIMNAWYMHFPENWPPSDDILPLMISMHINPSIASRIFTAEGINYLKKHGPVGCRDEYTERLLKTHGIPCYFSGCLTLTLGEKYTPHKKNTTLFVHPHFEFYRNLKGRLSILNVLQCLHFGLIYFKKIKRLQRVFYNNTRIQNTTGNIFVLLRKFLFFLYTAAFYKTYSSQFDDDVLFNAEYLEQDVRVGEGTTLVTEEDKINFARNLVQKYAEASLVITSRIHCALPCIGLKTPVLFVQSDFFDQINQGSRLEGLIDLFQIMRLKKFTLTKVNTIQKDYIPLKEALLRRCRDFVLQSDDIITATPLR